MSVQIALRHRFGDFDLDLAFEAPPGVTVLFGPSGSGKTTVVNAVAGLLHPDQGRIVVDGRVLLDTAARLYVPPDRRRLGYIFQEGRLFPHLNVRQNLLFGRWFSPRGSRRESLSQVVEMLGIGPLLSRRPGALSGGEKQRVAIGRALLSAPDMILADEPLAALDEARKAEILPYFERLRDTVSVPILYVSHAPAEVARLATTVVKLKAGRVTSVGAAAQILGGDPAVGRPAVTSDLSARVVAQHVDGMSALMCDAGPLWLPHVPDAPGALIDLRIAAHDVILSREVPRGLSALNILSGVIVDLSPDSGAELLVTLDLGSERLVAKVTRRSAIGMELAPGQPCHAIIKTITVAPRDPGAK